MMRMQDKTGEGDEVEIPLLRTLMVSPRSVVLLNKHVDVELQATSKTVAVRINEVESRGSLGLDEEYWQD